MTKIAILSDPLHPLFESSQKSADFFFSIHDFTVDQLPKEEILFIELTMLKREEKLFLLKEIGQHKNITLMAEAAHLWGDLLDQQLNNLAGLVATSFRSPKGACEVYLKNQTIKAQLEDLFKKMNLEILYTKEPRLGFTYPRVISMIINEAFFALDDTLAMPDSIDTAMKYGVNYPKGPFEWTELIGARPIVYLLDELAHITGDPRYRVSPTLRKKSKELL